ncbi:hypothetical protein SLA2020_285590 [Shorea laevis]
MDSDAFCQLSCKLKGNDRENSVPWQNEFQFSLLAMLECKEEMKLVLEVALLCTRSRPLDRPSTEDALKLQSGLKPQRKKLKQ